MKKGKFTAEHLQAGIFQFKDPNGRIICEVPMTESVARQVVNDLNRNTHNLDFRHYLRKHMAWSNDAFGEGSRLDGIIEHIEEELEEVKENPKDTREWVDIISLAIDGALREGASIGDLMNAMRAVQLRNQHRTWECTPPNRKANHVIVVDDPYDEEEHDPCEAKEWYDKVIEARKGKDEEQ